MLFLCFIIAIVVPYLVCGMNSAIIVTKIKTGKDIRTMGSGNAGLTNALRTQGKTAAALVLLGDVLKGVVSILIVRLAFYFFSGTDTDNLSLGYNFTAYIAGLFAVLGHVFPIYFGFRGGKGVLVTAAALFTIDWVSAAILVSIFAVIVAVTRYVSLGSVISGSLYPPCVLIVSLIRNDASAWQNLIFAIFIGLMLVFMHRENIKRLRNGTEKKLGQRAV